MRFVYKYNVTIVKLHYSVNKYYRINKYTKQKCIDLITRINAYQNNWYKFDSELKLSERKLIFSNRLGGCYLPISISC